MSVRAEDPPQAPVLPQPQQVIVEESVSIVESSFIPPYQRVNRYDVWRNYGVDQQGHWRYRVAFTPHGAFYVETGEPYPFWRTRPREFMSYVFD